MMLQDAVDKTFQYTSKWSEWSIDVFTIQHVKISFHEKFQGFSKHYKLKMTKTDFFTQKDP